MTILFRREIFYDQRVPEKKTMWDPCHHRDIGMQAIYGVGIIQQRPGKFYLDVLYLHCTSGGDGMLAEDL